MKTLAALLVGLCLVGVAGAQVVLFDDFEGYTLGSVSGQGTWQGQANSSWTVSDHEHSIVAIEGGNQVLNLSNQKVDGTIDTVYTAAAIPAIASTGTIYLKWKATGVTDCLLVTNDRPAGWWVDDSETSDGHSVDPDGQGMANYAEQATLSVLRADQFRAYNTNGYKNVNPVFVADTWYEMWIQIDVAAHASRYYVCEAGGTPEVVLNDVGGDWWGMRKQTYTQLSNIKFINGTGTSIQTVTIDDVGIDTNGFSLNAVPEPATMSLLALGGLALIRRRR
ncbi:MAG: PEP-CTERM sorting domain-containing protein [Planctomycetes bacterium]|nr:PEP-CTERM sorting domain-containing protein [Planctomycetota bacterium]